MKQVGQTLSKIFSLSAKHKNNQLTQVCKRWSSQITEKETSQDLEVMENNFPQMAEEMKNREKVLLQKLHEDPANPITKMSLATAASIRRVLSNEANDFSKNKASLTSSKELMLKEFWSHGFLLFFNSRDPLLTLLKKVNGYSIQIFFRAQERHHVLGPNADRFLSYNELEKSKEVMDIKFENPFIDSMLGDKDKIAKDMLLSQDNHFGAPFEEYKLNFLVVIQKDSNIDSYLVYDCEESYGEICINSVTIGDNIQEIKKRLAIKEIEINEKLPKSATKPTFYKPNFINLSEPLQKDLMEYMEAFEIDIQLVHNMHKASVMKQQNLFLEWLKETHELTCSFFE